MRVVLIHNPKAGDRKHSKKQLMATLTSTMQKITKEELGQEMLERVANFSRLAGADACGRIGCARASARYLSGGREHMAGSNRPVFGCSA